MLTLKNFLRRELEKQRVVLFYWLPVALACGIGCYLSLRQEPAPNLFIAMALLGGISYLGYHFQICSLAPFFLLLAVFCLGFFAVAGKAHYVAAPTLTYRFYGEIEGRIIGVDRARSGAVRVTLDQRGAIVGSPRLTQSRGDPVWRAAADGVLRAMRAAAPFDMPSDYQQQEIAFSFRTATMCGSR